MKTNIIKDLCQQNDLKYVLLITQQEVIYWYVYQDEEREKRLEIAKEISDLTGYKLIMTRETAGGMKDWFVQEYGKPGFTIEIGSSKYVGEFKQLPYSEYEKIWLSNRDIPEYLLKLVIFKLDNSNEQGEANEYVINREQLQNGSNGYGLYPIEQK